MSELQRSSGPEQYNFLAGAGKVRALLRAHDWSTFPLGKPGAWPSPFKTAIQLMLDSSQPTSLVWGEKLHFFYNDAYINVLGDKHPSALTRPFWKVWPEVRQDFEAAMQSVLGGTPVFSCNRPFQIYRHGMEKAWFTFSLLPIRDDDGKIAGALNPIIETTQQVVAEQRQSFELELVNRLRGMGSPDDIVAVAIKLLGQRLGASRVLYAEVHSDGTVFIRRDWTAEGVASMAGTTQRMDDFGPEIIAALRSRTVRAIDDVALDQRTSGYIEAFNSIGVRAELLVPLPPSDSLRVILAVHRAEPHHWSSEEIQMLKETGECTWIAAEASRAEEVMRNSEERLRALFESMSEAFLIMEADVTGDGKIADLCFIETNPAFDHHTKLTSTHGRTLRELMPDVDAIWREHCELVLRSGKPAQFEMPIGSSDHWLTVSITRLGGADSRRLAIVFSDITERKRAEEAIRHASLHDQLTGLPNRTMLFEYTSHMLPHSRRTSQCAAVLFIDLDRFKPINDTHSHEVGDAVLKTVAHRLAERARTEDIVVRLGGDEFVVLLQEVRNETAVADIARQIINRISEPYQIGELVLSLSASIGISVFPGDGEDIDTLISHADLAMYQAKQAGRNNFQFYSLEYSAASRLQSHIEAQLKSALRDETFHLYYQPVLDVATGDVVSVEALLRCQGIDVGSDRFIPVAEATGMINPIGRWVLAEAARQHKKWIEHGLPMIPIAVNVSVVEFRDKDFVDRFEHTMREYGIDTHALQVELTETAMMDDVGHAVQVLSRLKALGVKILLDDFGTGHSSLAYLARLPLNKVRIDKSFVAPLEKDPICRIVTNAMIALSRTLNLEVVAEGVETQSALDYIRVHGCTQVQGYYSGRPMSSDAFEHWYRKVRNQSGNIGHPNTRLQ